MATDPNSVLGQSDAIYTALSTFFEDTRVALSAGAAFPELPAIVSSLNYTELQRLASMASDGSASYLVGSAVETIHMATAVIREYGMRSKNKSEYYLDGLSDHTDEAEYYNKLKYSRSSLLKGFNTTGSMTT